MMSNIIDFPGPELKETSYSGGPGRDFGVINKNKTIEIIKLNKDEFLMVTPDGSQIHNRAALAEFFWVSVIFIDSEQKWHPTVDLVGLDY